MFLGMSEKAFTALVLALFAIGIACLYGSSWISNPRIARTVERLAFMAILNMAACFVVSFMVALHSARR